MIGYIPIVSQYISINVGSSSPLHAITKRYVITQSQLDPKNPIENSSVSHMVLSINWDTQKMDDL